MVHQIDFANIHIFMYFYFIFTFSQYMTSEVKLLNYSMMRENSHFYASAFRRQRHYVFGLSVLPKPEIPSFDLYMGLLVHPTNRNRFTACPSVRPSVRQSVHPSGEVSGHLSENAWREWPEILHADVSWPSSELISLLPWSVDFSNFGTILTLWNRSNLRFPSIFWRTHGGIGLKFCTLMYLDHF